jgi:hypothetical protein
MTYSNAASHSNMQRELQLQWINQPLPHQTTVFKQLKGIQEVKELPALMENTHHHLHKTPSLS